MTVLKAVEDEVTGVFYIVCNGIPITHDDEDWLSVSWVINGHAVRDHDAFSSRWVMFPNRETADLAAWAMREHRKFTTKLTSRMLRARENLHA